MCPCNLSTGKGSAGRSLGLVARTLQPNQQAPSLSRDPVSKNSVVHDPRRHLAPASDIHICTCTHIQRKMFSKLRGIMKSYSHLPLGLGKTRNTAMGRNADLKPARAKEQVQKAHTMTRIHWNLKSCVNDHREKEDQHTCSLESGSPAQAPVQEPSPPSPHGRGPAARAGTPGHRAGSCLGTESHTWKRHSERKPRQKSPWALTQTKEGL